MEKQEINTGNESLDEILKTIGPYLPKTPKAEPVEQRQWKKQDYTYPPRRMGESKI